VLNAILQLHSPVKNNNPIGIQIIEYAQMENLNPEIAALTLLRNAVRQQNCIIKDPKKDQLFCHFNPPKKMAADLKKIFRIIKMGVDLWSTLISFYICLNSNTTYNKNVIFLIFNTLLH
jgi:hypothetical protein